MATAGLSFADPFLAKVNVGEEPNPYAPYSPTSSMGAGGLAPSAADMAVMGESLVKQSQFTMPEMRKPPAIAFSPTTKELFVNGLTFASDDAATALQSEQYLRGPGTGLPTGGDWVPLDEQAYAQYLNSIRNPSLGRLASKAFGRGVDSMQMMAGRGAQLLGAEETGANIVEQQAEELRKTEPFERQFTDIESGRGAVEWFVANFAQQGPNLIESIVTAGAGFLAGTAAGGPAAGATAAFAGLMGKSAFKEAIKAAAQKKIAGEVLNAAEAKLLREAAGLAGAVATSYAQNLATGAADIYGELRDQGAGAEDTDARLKALAGSVPYAALETLPEFLLAGRLFGAGGRAALPAGASRTARAGELLKRGAIGGAVGGTAEGLTEAGQEGLLLGISEQDLSSPESVDRLINSFAAGFGVGGPIGAVANLKGKKPANLLNPAQNPEQTPGAATGTGLAVIPPTAPPTPGTGVAPYFSPVTPTANAPTPGTAQLQLPPPGQVLQVQGRPNFVVDSSGMVRQAMPEDTIVGVTANIPPGAQPGSQGVLDIFGGQPVTAGEIAARTQPVGAPPELGYTPTAPQADARQGALQFGAPAPTPVANTQMPNQLQAIQDRMRRQREFEAAQAQQQAQVQQQMEQIALQSRNARDLYTMQQAQQAAAQQPSLPMVPVTRPAPQQLPLFTRKQAPIPPRAGQLRRGGRMAAPVAPAEGDRGLRQATLQVPMFGTTGEPTLPALRAAGVKGKLSKPVPAKGVKQIPPTGKAVTPASVERAKAAEATKVTKLKAGIAKLKAKEAPSAIQKPSPAPVPARGRAATGKQVGEKVPSEKQAAGKGEALKAEAKVETVTDKLAARIAKGAFGGPAGALGEKLKQRKTPPAKKAEAAPAAAVEEEQFVPKTVAELEAIAQAKRAAQVQEEEQTPADTLAEDMQVAETATDIATFRGAIQTVLNYAYFTGEETNTKKLVEQARAFLATTQFSLEQVGAIDQAFLDAAQSTIALEAMYKGGVNKGKNKPWFDYAVSRNLLPSITVRVTNLPPAYKPQASPVSGKIAKTVPVETSAEKLTITPQARLAELIDSLVTQLRTVTRLNQEVKFQGASYANVVELAKGLYAATDAVGREYVVRGYKLKDYFTDKGEPKMLKSGGRFLITNRDMTTADQRKLEQEQKDTAKALAAEAKAKFEEDVDLESRLGGGAFNVEDDWDSADGMFYRDDGTPIAASIPSGRVQMIVKGFLSKLRSKPTTYVYNNVADLKARNPKLFARASAARKQGDFESTNSVGYSFGPNVIIFSDFVRTEQQLKFVLAHETLGHFGFKGVIPQAQLNEVLTRIYDADVDLQAAVDAMVQNQGMSKLEAVEEYLADNAADLDTSVIARIWNVLKNFLNKLGFDFRDDEARYFVNQARKYVRRGDGGNFVGVKAIVGDMEQLEQDRDDGRYARQSMGTLASRAFATGAMNRQYGGTGGLAGAMEAFAKGAFGARKDVPGRIASVLEQVQTLDNKARRSYGLNQIYRLLEKQQQYARALLSKYQRMTAFTHSPDVFGFGNGVTEAQKEVSGELLSRAALLRAAEATDEVIKSYDSLVSVDASGVVNVDPIVRQAIEKAGFVTAEEFRKGFDITYSNGEKVRFQFDVKEDSPEWKVYTELRETVNDAAIDLMLSNYEAAQAEGKRVISDLNAKRKGANVFTAMDLEAVRQAAMLYQEKRYAGSDVASAGVDLKRKSQKESEEFVVAFGRALFNDDVFAVWMKDPAAKAEIAKDMEEFLKAEYDDLRAQLPSLRSKIKGDTQSFEVQKAIRDLFMFDLQSKNADYYAKRTILGSYVPFTRRGSEQVRLVAVDERGNPVQLDENLRATLPYFQFDSRSEATAAAEELEAEFGGDNEWVMLDETGSETTVRLRPEVSKTRQSPDLTEAVNFNEFVYVLNRLNVNLAPETREKIVTTLTNQNSRARRNLQRSGTEGWDKNVVRSVSEHLETSAHVAAKKLYRHRLDDILLTTGNWLGDEGKLNALKDAVDSATSDGARARAQREYDEYAFMYQYMAGSRGGKTVTIGGKEVPTLGRGEDYREEAKQVLRWYSEASNITDSTEDMLSGEAGSALKLTTVLMQLGGSVATAVINLASLVTHSLPYLSYYNSARGFGGGYGEAKSATALWKAAKDLKNPNLSEDAFLNEMMRDGSYEQYGLTEDEAQFLFDQTEQGTLQASQFNALVGTARGKVFNNKAQAAIKLWMSMFSYTESVNRRVTALAAYRLEKDRALAQGVDEAQAITDATEAARKAVNYAQGEYAMFNRPEMARGNVLQYIFMYKQFVIVTVQLLRNMPKEGQLMMLGFLLLTSGLKGLPFAEDIFDIVDTIAQKLGLKMPSVEKALSEWIDAVAPGATPYLMRGALDRVTGATVSTRMGMGDLIPLTGAFRAGADPAREAADFAGPVFSGITGLVGMAGSLTKYGAEVTGLRDDTTDFNTVLRESPVAAFRSVGDSFAFLTDGRITNMRGQVVANEAPLHTVVARLLGFYPAIATEQNDIVRISKQATEYNKAIKAEYVKSYVKAKLAGDSDRMASIAEDVCEWNEAAKGTGLEITSFGKSANRAALEASRPTVARYLKSAPKQMRPETLELLRLNGLDDEIR